MNFYQIVLVVLAVTTACWSQRPFYAGLRPIGYPQITNEDNGLEDRFGEDDQLPILARGDRRLVNRLARLPEDQQPFWYLNWRQYEESLRNPQSWTPNRNSFVRN